MISLGLHADRNQKSVPVLKWSRDNVGVKKVLECDSYRTALRPRVCKGKGKPQKKRDKQFEPGTTKH